MRSGGWQAILDFMHPNLCALSPTVLQHSQPNSLVAPSSVWRRLKTPVSTPGFLRRLPGQFVVRLASSTNYTLLRKEVD
jgi:hypothetical protein